MFVIELGGRCAFEKQQKSIFIYLFISDAKRCIHIQKKTTCTSTLKHAQLYKTSLKQS